MFGYGDGFGKQAAFILLDVIPDYIEKAFHIKDGLLNGSVPVIRLGDTMPTDLTGALIIYNASDYHNEKAAELADQIRKFNPGCMIVALPVAG